MKEKETVEMPGKTVSQEKCAKENPYIMPISEVIEKVSAICKVNGVRRLDLFGSFATGTAATKRGVVIPLLNENNIRK